MGFLELRCQCGVSHEVRRGAQGASRVAPGKSGLRVRALNVPPQGLWTQLCCDTGKGLDAQVVWDCGVAALTSAVW